MSAENWQLQERVSGAMVITGPQGAIAIMSLNASITDQVNLSRLIVADINACTGC